MRTLRHDVLVVGSGVAGLSTALAIGECTILTRGEPGSGSSREAQGGIAAAVGDGDDPAAHVADTAAVGGGLVDPTVAETVTRAAPERIAWLERLGARFDRRGDRLALGREAGHSARRIVHARGDATGAEVVRALLAEVRRREVEILAGFDLVDLARHGDRIVGVLALGPDGEPFLHLAGAVVLATGGIGRLYLRTTNPPEVTGSGLAAAARAGALVADAEFVQFHPTALDVPADPVPLLTEALRGEGATLLSDARSLMAAHPDGDLAPRDVVARAVWERLTAGQRVVLDARGITDLPSRFPTVWTLARRWGFDPRRDPLPITPAQHFHMGGIAVDVRGRTSLPGLWAVGEVAATGLHGANRLASNSLLEGLALAVTVAEDVTREAASPPGTAVEVPADAPLARRPEHLTEVRTAAWTHLGVVRDADGLTTALERLSAPGAGGPMERDLRTVGRLVAEAALARTGSLGAHYRRDHPHPAAPQRSLLRPRPVPTRSLVGSAA